jgi:ParB/RepB/Spo0J family partition protein
MNAVTPTLTPLALENKDLLRKLAAGGYATKTALGASFIPPRDQSNLTKTLNRLEAEGLADPKALALTAAGHAALAAIGRAEGAETSQAHPAAGVMLRHDLIVIGALNPRKSFDPEETAELAASIARDDLLEPLVVRPADQLDVEGAVHQLVAGERRWRAIGLLIADGTWPADKLVPCMVKDIDDAAHRRIALVENLQRKDLRPLDEAAALKELMELEGKSTAEIAAEIGFTQRFVQQRLQLLALPPVMQVEMQAGKLSIEDARHRLARIKADDDARKAKILPPDELLALAEVIFAIEFYGEDLPGWYYSEKPVAVGFRGLEDGDPLARLTGRGALEVRSGWKSDARTFVRLEYGWSKKDVEAQLPGFLGKDRLRVLEAQRRAVLGEVEAERIAQTWRTIADTRGEFATWALNPEFADVPDPALVDAAQAYADRERERDAEDFHRKAAELQAAEARKVALAEVEADKGDPGRAFLAEVRDFEAKAANLGLGQFQTAFADLMTRRAAPGPHAVRWHDDDKAPVLCNATGESNRNAAFALEARRRLIAIAINFAMGFAPYSGPDIEAPYARAPETGLGVPAQRREDFLSEIEAYLHDLSTDLPSDDDQAEAIVETRARRGLEAYLEAEGIEYGDLKHDWQEDGAHAIARGIIGDGLGALVEAGGPEAEGADDEIPASLQAFATGHAKPIAEADADV